MRWSGDCCRSANCSAAVAVPVVRLLLSRGLPCRRRYPVFARRRTYRPLLTGVAGSATVAAEPAVSSS